jgi:RraA family protein
MNHTIRHHETGPLQVERDEPFPSSANLSDALGQLGLKFQTLHSRIRPITGLPVRGPAFTVQCYPGANSTVEEALEAASPGDVLVINGEAFPEAVLMGGLMSSRAKQRGLAGAVIDGAVRDVAELRQLQWPVFAVGLTPRAGTIAKLGQLNVPISCGDVVIRSGDMIAGDEDGIVAIPALEVEKTLALAREIENKEAFIKEAIERGLSLQEAGGEYKSRRK